MSRLKLMTIIGTRPEIIRLSAVIKKCDRYFDQILVHTGQNYDYELNQVFFDDLGLRAPDFYLDAVGADLGETIGNIIAKSYSIMVEQQPDALLILGDTNSCLSAIAAKRLHIPIFHMEAGNRCKDECLPEETNRRIVDIISDVNLAYSEHARKYLHECGLPKERTYVTGSPMAEVLHANLEKIEASDIHQRLGLEKGKPRLTNEAGLFSEQDHRRKFQYRAMAAASRSCTARITGTPTRKTRWSVLWRKRYIPSRAPTLPPTTARSNRFFSGTRWRNRGCLARSLSTPKIKKVTVLMSTSQAASSPRGEPMKATIRSLCSVGR